MIRPEPRRGFAKFLAGAAGALALSAAGCGESDAPQQRGAGAPAPPPARVSANEPGVRELLARVRARAVAGAGLTDATWGQDVAHLAILLWPTTDAAREDHVKLTTVAGDVGRDLARTPGERNLWAQRDAVSLEIHDAWLVATNGEPDVYRTWVESGGAALVKRMSDERAKLFPPR